MLCYLGTRLVYVYGRPVHADKNKFESGDLEKSIPAPSKIVSGIKLSQVYIVPACLVLIEVTAPLISVISRPLLRGQNCDLTKVSSNAVWHLRREAGFRVYETEGFVSRVLQGREILIVLRVLLTTQS